MTGTDLVAVAGGEQESEIVADELCVYLESESERVVTTLTAVVYLEKVMVRPDVSGCVSMSHYCVAHVHVCARMFV